jgi:hypothetical protein
MGAESGIPLMQQPVDPLCKELSRLLLLESLYHHVLDVSIQPDSTRAFWHFLEEPHVTRFHSNNLHIAIITLRKVICVGYVASKGEIKEMHTKCWWENVGIEMALKENTLGRCGLGSASE